MQSVLPDEIEIQGTPTHLIIRLERKSLQRNGILLKEDGKPVATLMPVVTELERPREAARFPEFEQEIMAFEQMKPELLRLYPGQAVAIFQGKVVATGKNKMDALRNTLFLRKIGGVPKRSRLQTNGESLIKAAI